MDKAGPSTIGLGVVSHHLVPDRRDSYRLSAAFPATFLDASGAFSVGWEATKGERSIFVVLALISKTLYFSVSEAGVWLFSGTAALVLSWQIIFGWLAMMKGLSILTTLYGHYIEKRSLA